MAYALWRFVPLYDDAACVRLGWPVVDRHARIALFLDAYGPGDHADILGVVLERQEVTRATVRTWTGPAYDRLRAEGRVAEIEGDMRFVERLRRSRPDRPGF